MFNIAEYKHILDFDDYEIKPIKEERFDLESRLYKCIKSFCEAENKNKYIVSLSGGVDSMVIISILHHMNIGAVAIHINYNNRDEAVQEQQFLEEWCEFNKIQLYVKSIKNVIRDNTPRSLYEETTKQIRFDFYKEIINLEQADNIILGHHKDDVVENIFTNVCKARSIFDLAVLKTQTYIDKVLILRPMLSLDKDDIFKFANTNQVPYFKDTTPKWSVRGKYRNNVYPQLVDTFGSNVKQNLLRLSTQTEEWDSLITNNIVNPFICGCVFNNSNVKFSLKEYECFPNCFWDTILMRLFYHFGHSRPSKKGINTFVECIRSGKKRCTISISKNSVCKLEDDTISIDFL
uniref:tRNA(Ile)-lysidine synthetase n=1 Tax=Pyramimonas orientalis virus TaxID=455367 RepID=A0A7M3UPF0_POV01|nr:hypothetical protein HWQ62_00506 [Pyramimonas orientalis virus]